MAPPTPLTGSSLREIFVFSVSESLTLGSGAQKNYCEQNLEGVWTTAKLPLNSQSW